MSEQSKQSKKAARKAAKRVYKESQTLSGLLRGCLLPAVIFLLAMFLLGLFVEFAPVKVFRVLYFIGGASLLFWGYRRFRAKWKNEEIGFGWHLMARAGKAEVFFALAGLSVMALSIWLFFNPRNFWETIESGFILLIVLGILFGLLTAAGILFALAAAGLRTGKSWQIIYALLGLLPFVSFVEICWFIGLVIFSKNFALVMLFPLACGAAALGYITCFYLVPAWRKKEKTS